jgi:hypothetical protein
MLRIAKIQIHACANSLSISLLKLIVVIYFYMNYVMLKLNIILLINRIFEI